MTDFQNTLHYAQKLDKQDMLAAFREQFFIPRKENGDEVIYFCGNSLGLQPKSAREYVQQELEDWQTLGVEGHFKARHPWMPYHEFLTQQTAELVGARPIEVVAMNTLTVNLHLLMVSFYRPTRDRYRILIEANAFPSDRYAVQSQLRFHGLDPQDGLLELPLRPGEHAHRTEDILSFIEQHGKNVALILLGGINYYSGQAFQMQEITRLGHAHGCIVGFDLAHAAGNLPLHLHNWNVDFAVWCSYKYLNGGPGCVAGAFVHERFATAFDLPRFAGWWGHDKDTRFLMGPEFHPIAGAEGWQLSNPPILPLASLRASLDLFQRADFAKLRWKSEQLTGYLEFLLRDLQSEDVHIITPRAVEERGCQLSIRVKRNGRRIHQALQRAGVVCDWREPDVIRVAPVPMYNTFTEVYRFSQFFAEALQEAGPPG